MSRREILVRYGPLGEAMGDFVPVLEEALVEETKDKRHPWSYPPRSHWPPPWPWRPIPVVFFLARGPRGNIVRLQELVPNRRVTMNPITVSVGHSVSMAIAYLDQFGNPMLTPVTPDSAPTWSDTTPATGTLTVAPGGLSADEMSIAVGSDLVNLSLTVGGVSFAASQGITVTAVPQTLTSVAIDATVDAASPAALAASARAAVKK